MKWIFRGAFLSITIIFFLCICLSLIQMPDVSDQWSFEVTEETSPDPPTPPAGPSVTPGGPTVTPSQATCPNAGVSYPDNPFSGWPQAGRSWGDINYYYCDPVYEQDFGRTHWGIDIDAQHGEPVYATADGIVVRVSNDTVWGMGKNVKFCTPTAWCAVYMHLTDWAVDTGDLVSKGDVLGYANNTGNSTGTHLHYQIETPAGYTVDPAPTFN